MNPTILHNNILILRIVGKLLQLNSVVNTEKFLRIGHCFYSIVFLKRTYMLTINNLWGFFLKKEFSVLRQNFSVLQKTIPEIQFSVTGNEFSVLTSQFSVLKKSGNKKTLITGSAFETFEVSLPRVKNIVKIQKRQEYMKDIIHNRGTFSKPNWSLKQKNKREFKRDLREDF